MSTELHSEKFVTKQLSPSRELAGGVGHLNLKHFVSSARQSMLKHDSSKKDLCERKIESVDIRTISYNNNNVQCSVEPVAEVCPSSPGPTPVEHQDWTLSIVESPAGSRTTDNLQNRSIEDVSRTFASEYSPPGWTSSISSNYVRRRWKEEHKKWEKRRSEYENTIQICKNENEQLKIELKEESSIGEILRKKLKSAKIIISELSDRIVFLEEKVGSDIEKGRLGDSHSPVIKTDRRNRVKSVRRKSNTGNNTHFSRTRRAQSYNCADELETLKMVQKRLRFMESEFEAIHLLKAELHQKNSQLEKAKKEVVYLRRSNSDLIEKLEALEQDSMNECKRRLKLKAGGKGNVCGTEYKKNMQVQNPQQLFLSGNTQNTKSLPRTQSGSVEIPLKSHALQEPSGSNNFDMTVSAAVSSVKNQHHSGNQNEGSDFNQKEKKSRRGVKRREPRSRQSSKSSKVSICSPSREPVFIGNREF